jgi:hypothetical protein
MLYIDGILVVNNDGLHAQETVTDTINLTQGTHLVKLAFYNNQGYKSLVLSWIKPGDIQSIIESSYFSQ